MKLRASSAYLLLVLTTVLYFLSIQPLVARPAGFDDFGNTLARQIADAKIHSLAVAEFATPEGANSPRGKYLAELLCETWLKHHGELTIVNPTNFGRTLAAQRFSLQELKTPDSWKQIGKALGIEAVVSGSLTDRSDGYLLTITVRTVSEGAAVLTMNEPVAHSLVLDSLAATDADTTSLAPRAGAHGAGTPACTYMPAPDFPAEARKAKITATNAMLRAVITPDGRVTNISVTKDPGYGFALRAVEAVAKWRCKPALDNDKKPMAVTVPIEITFRDSQ